jgi:hypothetical protein
MNDALSPKLWDKAIFHEMQNELMFPHGCVCSKASWEGADEVKEICEKYETIYPQNYKYCDASYCKNCEHDKECHERTS